MNKRTIPEWEEHYDVTLVYADGMTWPEGHDLLSHRFTETEFLLGMARCFFTPRGVSAEGQEGLMRKIRALQKQREVAEDGQG